MRATPVLGRAVKMFAPQATAHAEMAQAALPVLTLYWSSDWAAKENVLQGDA